MKSTLEFLTENDWSLILAKARRVSYRLGEEIIQEGLPGKAIYVLRKGTASVEVARPGGRVEIAVLGPGEICGDMSLLLKDDILKDKTCAFVRAASEAEADQVDAEELGQLFDAFPSVAARFYHSLAVLLARRLRDTSLALATSGKYKEAIR